MGKAISSLGKRAIRPFLEFNLEARVNKEISKDKPISSPWHKSTSKLIEETIHSQPDEVKKNLQEKDEVLMDRLKQVYVMSEDVKPQQPMTQDPNRPLPADRTTIDDPEFGYVEPKSVPYGKITLRSFVEAVSRHQQDPEVWTARKISYEYKLDTGLTEKLLRHFRTFVLVLPKDSETPKITQSTLKTIPISKPPSIEEFIHSTSEKESSNRKGES